MTASPALYERVVSLGADLGAAHADLYVVHQAMWQAMAPWHGSAQARRFTFARLASGCWLVRSPHFPPPARRAPALAPRGRLKVELAAVTANAGRTQPIAPDQRLDWAHALLRANGIDASRTLIAGERVARGVKPKKDVTGEMHIVYPVVEVVGPYRVLDPALALQAYACGVGRGKRFGMGLMRVQPFGDPAR